MRTIPVKIKPEWVTRNCVITSPIEGRIYSFYPKSVIGSPSEADFLVEGTYSLIGENYKNTWVSGNARVAIRDAKTPEPSIFMTLLTTNPRLN